MLKWTHMLSMAYPSSSVDSIIRKKFKSRNSETEIDVKSLGFVFISYTTILKTRLPLKGI
jgi:hypothetical protein